MTMYQNDIVLAAMLKELKECYTKNSLLVLKAMSDITSLSRADRVQCEHISSHANFTKNSIVTYSKTVLKQEEQWARGVIEVHLKTALEECTNGAIA